MPVAKNVMSHRMSIEEPTSNYGEPTYKHERQLKGFGIRHGQLIIFCVCLTISFIARGHIGVTIVAMTNPIVANNTDGSINNITDVQRYIAEVQKTRNITHNEGNMTTMIDTNNKKTAKEIDEDNKDWSIFRTYNWTKPVHETVMSSFYLGYCIAMLPMGLVAQRWGGKLPLQLSLLLNSVLSLLTPWLALWGGWKAVSACRLMQGLSQAGTYPSIQALLSSWAPTNERASMSSYVYTGTALGNIVAFQIGGLLADSVGGWPSTFWVVGLMCFVCFVLLTICGAATPLAHTKITVEEKILIRGHSDGVAIQGLNKRIPWIAILTSVPVWATFITHAGSSASFTFFSSQVASYNHYILGINVKNSGFLSSMPYIAGLCTSLGYGWISDYLTQNNLITLKTARRLFNSLASVGMAASLIGVTFATNTVMASLCFIIFMATETGCHCGNMVNYIDIASKYTGTLMSIGNTLTNIINLIIPVLMSYIVVDLRNSAQWHTMLYLVAGMCLVTNMVFVVFLSVEDQPWNQQQVDEAEVEEISAKEK